MHLLTFGVAREIAGASRIDLAAEADVPPPGTVAELHARLLARFPALADVGAVRYAVNQRFADDDTPLPPGDELAIIPPVSGG